MDWYRIIIQECGNDINTKLQNLEISTDFDWSLKNELAVNKLQTMEMHLKTG